MIIKNITAGANRRVALAIAALVLSSSAALAASSVQQTVNFSVSAIDEIDIGAASVTLTVNSATAGSQPTAATAQTTYSITTNAATNAKKITAALNTNMPTGLTLTVNVTAPSAGSTSAGTVTLTNSAVDVVTGVETVAANGVNIDYSLSATVAAGVVASDSRTVTYTIAASS